MSAAIVIGTVASLFVMRHLRAEGTEVRGELVDTYCWGALKIGGPPHAACGIECANRGIPLAIYDARTRKAFVLLPGRDKERLPQDLIAAMGKNIRVRGDVIERGGSAFVTVRSWELE